MRPAGLLHRDPAKGAKRALQLGGGQQPRRAPSSPSSDEAVATLVSARNLVKVTRHAQTPPRRRQLPQRLRDPQILARLASRDSTAIGEETRQVVAGVAIEQKPRDTEPDPDESPFELPPIEGLPFARDSEEAEAIRRVIEQADRERASGARVPPAERP